MAAQYAKDQPRGFTNRIERVAIVGASGRVGGYIARALLETGRHTVTALSRAGSNSETPKGAHKVEVSYDDEDALVAALKGQDFLVITLPGRAAPGTHSKLVQAAAKAGIRYVMPNWYGGDAANTRLHNDTGLGPVNAGNVAEIQSKGMRSVLLANGFWYEWSLGMGPNALGFDLGKRTLVLYDEGDVRINTSTWPQCGRAVAALLSLNILPEDEGDKAATLSQFLDGIVYVSSFRLSQRDMYESVRRVTGTADEDWTVTHEPSEKRWREGREAMQQGDMSGFVRQLYVRNFFAGDSGDFESVRGLHNDVLGLPKEDLDEYTRITLRMVENKELPYIG